MASRGCNNSSRASATWPSSQRANLQRQADQALRDIDTIAAGTLVNDSILHGRLTADAAGEVPQPTPFRGFGTAALGLDGLTMRSADQVARRVQFA